MSFLDKRNIGEDIKNIILIGGGGHCKSCIEIIESCNTYNIYGVIDNKQTEIADLNLLGNDSVISSYTTSSKNYFLITVGQIKSASLRKTLFNLVCYYGGSFATVISPFSHVSRKSFIQDGSIIFHNVQVNAGTRIGKNVILNNKSLIEHDCVIGDHCHISTGAILNGNCTIGDEVLIGSNSVIIQGINITSDVVIGAGSVVINDILEPGIYVGNPAKKISDNNE